MVRNLRIKLLQVEFPPMDYRYQESGTWLRHTIFEGWLLHISRRTAHHGSTGAWRRQGTPMKTMEDFETIKLERPDPAIAPAANP